MLKPDLKFIYRYFIAEKQESALFIAVGVVALLVAVAFFFFVKNNSVFYKGLAVPLILIGIIQIIVGLTVYTRSDKQKIDVAYNIGLQPAIYIKQQEEPRMEKVMKSFVVYRWVGIALVLTGLILVFLFRANPDKSFWYGLGTGLALQAAVMLGTDYFAEKRGEEYTQSLRSIIEQSAEK